MPGLEPSTGAFSRPVSGKLASSMPNAIGMSSSGSNLLPMPRYSSTNEIRIMIRLRGSSRNAAKPESARMLPSAQIEPIVPARGAQISFSIFIASRMNRTSPAFTCWPAVQRMSRIVPGIGAATVSPPAGAAAGAGAGAAAGAGAGAALGAEAGAAPTGVPVTVPRSTMTSYCLPLSDTIYFIVVFPLKLP